jgi:predicted MFS family arabinose efflux permease
MSSLSPDRGHGRPLVQRSPRSGAGLALVGFSLGYITAGPIAAALIARVGWRAAYAWLGGGCGVLTLLAALTVRRRAADRPHPRAIAPSGAIAVSLRPASRCARRWPIRGSGI